MKPKDLETVQMSDPIDGKAALAELMAKASDLRDFWVIQKHGWFYRPNSQGYTSDIEEAGRYSEVDARKEAQVEDSIKAIHASKFPTPKTPIVSLEAIRAIAAYVEQLVKALRGVESERL